MKWFYFQQSRWDFWEESLSFPQQGFKPVEVPGHMPASVTSGCTLTQTHPAACFFSLVQSSRSVKRKTWRSFLEPSTSSTIKRSLSSCRFCQRKQEISGYKVYHTSTSTPITAVRQTGPRYRSCWEDRLQWSKSDIVAQFKMGSHYYVSADAGGYFTPCGVATALSPASQEIITEIQNKACTKPI